MPYQAYRCRHLAPTGQPGHISTVHNLPGPPTRGQALPRLGFCLSTVQLLPPPAHLWQLPASCQVHLVAVKFHDLLCPPQPPNIINPRHHHSSSTQLRHPAPARTSTSSLNNPVDFSLPLCPYLPCFADHTIRLCLCFLLASALVSDCDLLISFASSPALCARTSMFCFPPNSPWRRPMKGMEHGGSSGVEDADPRHSRHPTIPLSNRVPNRMQRDPRRHHGIASALSGDATVGSEALGAATLPRLERDVDTTKTTDKNTGGLLAQWIHVL